MHVVALIRGVKILELSSPPTPPPPHHHTHTAKSYYDAACIIDFCADGIDYAGNPVVLTFRPNSATRNCADINIVDDNLLEGNEFFSVSLTVNDEVVIIPVATVLVILRDSDSKFHSKVHECIEQTYNNTAQSVFGVK
jgi:hypothetical protein